MCLTFRQMSRPLPWSELGHLRSWEDFRGAVVPRCAQPSTDIWQPKGKLLTCIKIEKITMNITKSQEKQDQELHFMYCHIVHIVHAMVFIYLILWWKDLNICDIRTWFSFMVSSFFAFLRVPSFEPFWKLEDIFKNLDCSHAKPEAQRAPKVCKECWHRKGREIWLRYADLGLKIYLD